MSALEKLLEEVRAEADAAYARGYADAMADARAALAALSPAGTVDQDRSQLPEAAQAKPALPVADKRQEPLSRAPRGLVDDVLDQVLAATPGMTIREVEEAVCAADSRIAVKSIYNRLRAYEKQGEKFRRVDGKWYRLEDHARMTVLSSSQEETGSQAAPRSQGFFTHLGGGVGALPEAGGT